LADVTRLSEPPLIALGDMILGWFARVASADTYSRQEAEQLRVPEILEKLFRAMSDTQSTTAINHLHSLLWAAGRSWDPIIALGDITVGIFAKGTSADGVSMSEAEQLHILKILDKLLFGMPRTQPAAAVYLRLCAPADPAHLSEDVRKKLAELIVGYYYKFEDDIKDIRQMLSAISSFKDLDPREFSDGIANILKHLAKLPQANFEGIHNELRGALATVAGYFGRPNPPSSLASFGWGHFSDLSNACVALARVDNSLFSPEIIDSLGRFSFLCPDDDGWKRTIQNSIQALREVTGVPPHPEAVPAVNSQSSSAADS